MKLRVYRAHVAQSINWFQERLTVTFGARGGISEAHKEIMRRELRALQQMQVRQQKTNSWMVPLSLNFAADGTFQVSLDSEDNLLYLDEPVTNT